MNLLLTNEALASFHRLKAKNPGEAEWVRQELKKIVAEPFPANNPPDALSGVLKGLWLRKYGSRGRIFYRTDDDHFEIAAGKWLQEYPHVYEMILREFNLPAERCSARYAVHWDISASESPSIINSISRLYSSQVAQDTNVAILEKFCLLLQFLQNLTAAINAVQFLATGFAHLEELCFLVDAKETVSQKVCHKTSSTAQ